MPRPMFGVPMVLSMVPFHALGHNDQNEVKDDFSSHVMALLPALQSFDINHIINGTIYFIR